MIDSRIDTIIINEFHKSKHLSHSLEAWTSQTAACLGKHLW